MRNRLNVNIPIIHNTSLVPKHVMIIEQAGDVNVASLSNDVSKVRNQILDVTQKLENEMMLNKKGSEELHACTSTLQRQMETAKTQLKDISAGKNE